MSTIPILLSEARVAGVEVERARQEMQGVAERRQKLLLGLHERGMSIRAIGDELGITSGTAQQLIDKAREVRKSEGLFRRREFRVSYELYVEIVRHFHRRPAAVVSAYERNYPKVRQHLRGEAVDWLEQWRRALGYGPDEFAEFALCADDLGESIRSVSPFAGVLTSSERARAIRRAVGRAV